MPVTKTMAPSGLAATASPSLCWLLPWYLEAHSWVPPGTLALDEAREAAEARARCCDSGVAGATPAAVMMASAASPAVRFIVFSF
jgi:hypothetical protein